jgi:hypothetical protein
VTKTRRSYMLKRLERLEAAQQRRAGTAGRQAFVVMGFFDGERHLVMTHSDGGRCWFQEQPGSGPQLADFGEFALILHLTEAEANM